MSEQTVHLRRDGVVVRGPDAAEWLQGQLTQDLAGLEVGESRYSLVLSPQGKLASFCRATRSGEEEYLLDTEAGFGPDLEDRLRRFKLRVKVDLEAVELSCEAGPGGGLSSLGPPRVVEEPPPVPDEASLTRLEEARIRSGLPRLGRELTERTIAQEAGEAFVQATVSFTKGCYTGQELVARLDARGSNVARRLRLIEGSEPASPPEPGAAIYRGEAEVGEVTSAAPSGASFVALGYLKRAVLGEEPFDVLVGGPAGERARARVSLLPAEA